MSASRCLILGAAVPAVWLLAGAAARAESAAIPFARLAGFRTAFNAMPAAQRDKLIFLLAIEHADKTNHAPIRAWVEDGGKHIDIPVGAAGGVTLPERPDWAARGVLVQTDQPKGSLGIGIDLAVVLPPGQTIAVSYLLDAVAQGNAAMRAGARALYGYMASLMAPAAKEVDITLAGCCGGTATLRGDGAPVVLKQAASGVIAIPLGTLQGRAAGSVTLSGPARLIDLFPD